MSTPASGRRLLPALAVSVGLLLAGQSLVPASAAPRPTLDQVKAQVADLNKRAEAAAEAYNAGRIELRTAQARLASNQRAVRDAKARVDSQRAVIGKFAADAYRNGGAGGQDSLAVLLTTNDMTAAMQKLTTLEALERRQTSAMRGIEAAKQRLSQAELVADQQAERARAIDATMTSRQSEVRSLLDDATKLLDRLTAEEKARLAAERAAEARAQAREAAADRARQAAAERQRAAAAAAEARASRPATSAPSTSRPDPSPSRSSAPTSSRGGSKAAERAVQAALSKLGRPYVWAAAGPNSFDCSGLIQWAYKQVGIDVAHYTGAIWNSFPRVSRSELRRGDIVFYYPDVHHAGIYLGGGKMVHAPQTGDVVKISDAFAGRDYTGAVRITG